MSQYRWDDERGMASINRSPDTRDLPTADELKRWLTEGAMPYTQEPDRCPACGRAEQCECPDCRFCDGGIPCPDLWSPTEQKRWGVGPYQPNDPTGTE